MAPKAPIGAAHITIARMRKTSRWMCSMPRRIGWPAEPMPCSAKPASSAISRVCRTDSLVKAETIVVGMIPSRNSVVPFASASTWA